MHRIAIKDPAMFGTAFTVHSGCWQAFAKHFEPGELILDRILDVLKTVPFPFSETRIYMTLATEHYWRLLESNHRDTAYDSRLLLFDQEELPHLELRNLPEDRFSREVQRLPFPQKGTTRGNIFEGLPFDILMMIGSHLWTKDAFNFCSVSRETYAISLFDWQWFWKSRFLLDGEFGYLNFLVEDETRVFSSKDIYWRCIYSRAKELQHGKTFSILRFYRKHRQRLEWFRDRYRMVRAPEWKIDSSQRSLSKSLRWTKVKRRFRCDTGGPDCAFNYHAHDHPKFNQTVILHPSVYQLKISILEEEEETYVTGIELISRDMERPNTIFGYSIPNKQVTIDIETPRMLRGFDISKGEARICALRVYTGSSYDESLRNSPQWIGKPNTTLITRLVSKSEIIGLWGKFDVSKISSKISVRASNEKKLQYCKMNEISIGRIKEPA